MRKTKCIFLFSLALIISIISSKSYVYSQATAPIPFDPQPYLDSVLPGVQASLGAGMTPIIRVGVHGAGEFVNPDNLITFITELNSQVSGTVWLIAGPNEPESEIWAAPECGDGNGACIGPPVAAYMNKIISGAGNLSNIKLLSPAFNLCSPVFPSLIAAMGSANWGGLDGIAVNVYNGTPVGTNERTINSCLASRLPLIPSNLPVIITETGAFDKNLSAFKSEIDNLNSRVLSALLFNGLNTNPGWSQFALSDGDINTVCNGNCRNARVGVNFATIYTSGNYPRASSLNMGYTLEILGQGGGPIAPPDFDRLTRPCSYDSLSYHPLRTDPFNPCDPLIVNRNELRFSCGSALTTTGGFEFPNVRIDQVDAVTQGRLLVESSLPNNTPPQVNPDEIYLCDDTKNNPPEDRELCAIRRVPYDVTFDFTGAQLPIIGNTQLSGLDDATRMNHYLSSYLNGTVQHAEQNRPNYNSPAEIDRIVNFSGPLKKLLPRYGLENIKQTVRAGVGNADIHNSKDIIQNIFSNLPLSNNEDIMGETQVSVVPNDQPAVTGGYVVPYGYSILMGPERNINRITLFIKKAPSPNIPYSDGRLYLPHLRDAAGMSESLRNYALPYQKSPDDKTLQNPFRTLNTKPDCSGNQSAACKRLMGTYDKNNHQSGPPDGSIAISQYTWNEFNGFYEGPTRNTVIIDNPLQIGQGNNLVLNQGNQVPKSVYAPRIFATAKDDLAMAPGPLGLAPDPECRLTFPDSPGDSIVDKKGWQIRAKLTYTQLFRWKPLPPPCGAPPGDNPTCSVPTGLCSNGLACGEQYECLADVDYTLCSTQCAGVCSGAGAGCDACRQACIDPQLINGRCEPRKLNLPTKARVVLFNKTPLVDRIYEDLVSGFQSVLRRFLPGRTPALVQNNCGTGEYIKGEYVKPDTNPSSSCVRPASTNFASGVAVGGSTGDNPPTHRNIAGEASNEPYSPSLLFPYLGSLQDYFLGCGKENLNLQNMFRPQGITSSCGISSGPSSVTTSKAVILILGQSNAANYGDTTYSASSPNVQVLYNNSLYPLVDPIPFVDGVANGPGGSPWSRLGDLLVTQKGYSQVIFINAAVGSTNIDYWANGAGKSRITTAINAANSAGLAITQILWHHGETDAATGTSGADYQTKLSSIISYIRSLGVSAPFYAAKATVCHPSYPNPNTAIRAAQAAVATGPDTDALKAIPANIGTTLNGSDNRCHFSGAGLMAHAQAWLGSISGSTGSVPPFTGGSLCTLPTTGFCSPTDPTTNLQSIFSSSSNSNAAKTAALICKRESGGNPNALNANCLKTPGAGYTRDYSVGLFQFNLLAHPARAFLNTPAGASLKSQLPAGTSCFDFIQDNHPNSCVVKNQSMLDICTYWFRNPINNVAYLLYASANGTNWGPWKVSVPALDVTACYP